jgi:hypothetical protein
VGFWLVFAFRGQADEHARKKRGSTG